VPASLSGDITANYRPFKKLTKVGNHTVLVVGKSGGTVVGSTTLTFAVAAGMPPPRDLFFDCGVKKQDHPYITTLGKRKYVNLNADVAVEYQTQRYSTSGTLAYTIPGFYPFSSNNKLVLGFAEIYSPDCVTGKRVMNVTVNDVPLQTAFDVFDTAGGCNIGTTLETTATANGNGEIMIEITADGDYPMISFIQFGTRPVEMA
jgi:Malectin domain